MKRALEELLDPSGLPADTPGMEEFEDSKSCTSCGRELPEDAFPPDERHADKLSSVCRACQRLMGQEWERRPEVRISRNAKRRQRRIDDPEWAKAESQRVMDAQRRARLRRAA